MDEVEEASSFVCALVEACGRVTTVVPERVDGSRVSSAAVGRQQKFVLN